MTCSGSDLLDDTRAWSLELGATGVFLWSLGAFVLGVTLNVVLLICAALLVGMVLVPGPWARRPV